MALVVVGFTCTLGQESAVQDRALRGSPTDGLNGEKRAFFENRVRPLLIERCYTCHSHGEKPAKANIYLDSKSG